MSDVVLRSQLLMVRAQRLAAEAEACTDPARIEAIYHEVRVIQDSCFALAEEQALEAIEEERKRAERSWWRRLLP